MFSGGDTMYTNLANLQQTMLLQQRMFLQALCQQNSIVKNSNEKINDSQNDSSKKHFIAPSLSQYRFVSGQQVRISENNTKHLCRANRNDCHKNTILFIIIRHIHIQFSRNQVNVWNGK